MTNFVIYCVINQVNGKIYIGKTDRGFLARKRDHKQKYRTTKPHSHFYNALRMYGWEAFSWRVLDHAEDSDTLSGLEKEYIELFGSNFKEIGYNIHLGGSGGAQTDPEVLNRIGENTRRYAKRRRDAGIPGPTAGKRLGPLSEDHKKKLSISLKGHECSDETRDKLRQAKLGKKHSSEHNKKIAEKGKGRKATPEAIQKRKESRQRAVRCIETDEIWPAISDAARAKLICSSGISKCLAGNQRMAGGFTWEYV